MPSVRLVRLLSLPTAYKPLKNKAISHRKLVLRGYLRQRQTLVRYAGQHVQHMQKALEQMNIKLTEVVSDITGVTGLDIIRAILAGVRDPATLAKLRNEHCKVGEAGPGSAAGELARGAPVRPETGAGAVGAHRALIRDCDAEIERNLKSLPDRSGGADPAAPPRVRKPKPTEPAYDARGLVHRACGVDLTAIEGIDQRTALVLLGEVGPDLSRFPTAKKFCAWLGLCPQHQIGGGKV